MMHLAKRYVPDGWDVVDPDTGMGFQLQRVEALDPDNSVLSVSFEGDTVTISLSTYGFGLRESRSFTTRWDGERSSIPKWADKALDMAVTEWGYSPN